MQARKGRGCAHCEEGHPIYRVRSPAGSFRLCLECVLLWFPGRGGDWFEEHHRHFADHLDEALKRAREREAERNLAALVQQGRSS